MGVTQGRRTLVLGLAGLVAVAAGTVIATQATADPGLPPLSAEELLTRVASAKPDGLSATFVQDSDLGLPALPAQATGDDIQDALAMLTGDHTVRVWVAGPDRAKAALVDGATETSVIRNGNEVWRWSSESQQARHSVLPADAKPTPSATPASPTDAVRTLLEAVEPTTDVATSGTGYVAGRPVYQLVLTPKDDASLVGQVRVSVDATEFVPLAFRVIADDGSDAISVAASSVDFARPDDAVFAFSPPPGAEVVEEKLPAATGKPAKPDHDGAKVTGTGWTTVVVADLNEKAEPDQSMTALLESLPKVSGAWGSGRLLSTALVNAVITDDGRVAAGSVVPERLYAALAAR
jgi:outer membrane lipoprotein-sorting protein